MSTSNYVGVQFQSKHNADEFSGRVYSYKTAIDLSVGDIVVVPTSNGEGVARVSEINVPESRIDERVMPLLKTIEKRYIGEEKPEERPETIDEILKALEETYHV